VLPLFQLLGIRSKHSGMMLGLTPPGLGPPYGLHVPGDRILWSSRALVMCIVSLTRLSSRTAAEVTQVGEVEHRQCKSALGVSSRHSSTRSNRKRICLSGNHRRAILARFGTPGIAIQPASSKNHERRSTLMNKSWIGENRCNGSVNSPANG